MVHASVHQLFVLHRFYQTPAEASVWIDALAQPNRRDIVSRQAIASTEAPAGGVPVIPIPDLDHDPHGIFRRHRPHTPFICRPDGSYIAIRARDVESLITDPRTRQLETELYTMRGITEGPLIELLGNSMLFSNGDAHRRRRAPMSRAFAFRIMAALRPGIRAIADELIENRLTDGRMDLVGDYAALIPARTIAAILGLPEEDVPHFTDLVYSVSRALTPSFTPEDVPGITEAARQLLDYCGRLVVDRRASPRDDFLTTFLRVAHGQSELTPIEILAQIGIVIMGGSDTTRAAMAIQTALLLQNPEQWRAVCDDYALIPGAVSEALRYEPVAGSVPRFTLADIEIDGCIVPAGRLLTLSTLSAMRDPALYADPERFDIHRTDHPRWHPVFGGGVHRCLGEALARVELEEGLAALTSRIPQLRLDGEPARVIGHSGLRRLNGLRVAW
jgi:cytochrome P450